MVLVADDDMTIRFLARELLEQNGFAVEEAEDGVRALSLFEQVRPDIVLLDVIMPKMHGFAVCASLRSHPDGSHLPILMITGLDDLDSINHAYEVGATDFITKPINWMILGHRVRYMWRASRAADKLRRSEEKNRALIDAMPDLMFQIDKDGTILDSKVPANFCPLLPTDRLVGKKIDETFFTESSPSIMEYIDEVLKTREARIFEHHARDNHVQYSYESRLVVSGNSEVLAIVRNITERKKAEQQIIYLAYHDTLTGLLNRHSFKERLEEASLHAQRYERLAAVLFLDLDRFKRINDTLGHNIGDLLLQGMADRLVNCLRKTDRTARTDREPPPPAVARLGGDEFTILLTDLTQIQDAAHVARRILKIVAEPFNLMGHEVFITASIGITMYPIDGNDVDTLLKNADTAMYHAKDQGRNNFQFYSHTMNATAFDCLALENGLRKALDREEFILYYQPQLDIRTGKIVAVEALIRWQSPDLGLVPPPDFISLAEETGLIQPIGDWVLSTACLQNKAWQDAGFGPLRVTVNLSSHQFRQRDLLATVTRALKDSGLPPALLELELTESAIMQNVETTNFMLAELKAMGLRLAIDDFGTGYSSLSYLKRFPLDVLKVDRSFVHDITTDPDDAAITAAIIAMAHSLNLKVIAEGVETEEQLAFLKAQGCDEIQGFLFSRPLPVEDLTKLLQEKRHL